MVNLALPKGAIIWPCEYSTRLANFFLLYIVQGIIKNWPTFYSRATLKKCVCSLSNRSKTILQLSLLRTPFSWTGHFIFHKKLGLVLLDSNKMCNSVFYRHPSPGE